MEAVDYYIFMDSPASRLQQLMDEHGINQAELTEKTKKSKGLISSYLNPDNKPSDIFLRIVEDKLGWSARWIRTGEGPQKINLKSTNSSTPYIAEPAPDYVGRTDYNVIRQVSSDKPNMWLVPIKAQAGFAKGFEGRTFAGQIQRVAWPLIQGECFCFEVEGLSMLPQYLPNSWVICTILQDRSWLRQGRNYVFQTFDGIVIKQFDWIDDDNVHLKSLNPDYGGVPSIPLNELRVIYAIDGRYQKD